MKINNSKPNPKICYTGAAAFSALGLMYLIFSKNYRMGFMWLCLGMCWALIGVSYGKREDEDDKKKASVKDIETASQEQDDSETEEDTDNE